MQGERSHYITTHSDIGVTSSQAQATASLKAPLYHPPPPRTSAAAVGSLIKERKKTDPHTTTPGQQSQKRSSTLLNEYFHNFKNANDSQIETRTLSRLPNCLSIWKRRRKNSNKHSTSTAERSRRIQPSEARSADLKAQHQKSSPIQETSSRIPAHKLIQKSRIVSRQSIPRSSESNAAIGARQSRAGLQLFPGQYEP